MALEEIKKIRLEKLSKITEKGLLAYPVSVTRTATIKDIQATFSARMEKKESITLVGRVMSQRGQGALIFFDFFDGTARMQGLLKKDEMDESLFNFWREVIDVGDFVEVSGELFVTKSGQETIKVSAWRILSKSLLPLPDSWYGLKDEEEVFRKRYIDILLNEDVRASIERRSKFWNAFRTFLLERGYIEVETPVLETTTGGADARPFVTHHNALDIEVYLRISCGELWQKKLLVAGLPKVFEIGRIFRNEGISHEHAQDYTQIEFYEAFSDYKKGMEMVRDLYIYVAKKTFERTVFTIQGVEVDLEKEWEIYDYVKIIKDTFAIDAFISSEGDIVSKLKEHGIAFDVKAINKERGIDLLWKVCRKKIVGPGFLVNVPVYMEPLAKKSETDPRVVERFQIILGGSEMGKGFSELNDPIDQAERFAYQESLREGGDDEAHMKDDSFVEALEYGMPPAFGFGVSERLFSVLSGKPLREAQIFPLMKPILPTISKKQAEERYRSKKFVAIADPSHGYGVTANALGQLGISIGGFSKEKIFDRETLTDKDGNTHYVDGLYPMTNLAGNQKEMAYFVSRCVEAGIQFFDFSMIMRKAHSDEEMQKGYQEHNTNDVPYIAVGALVPKDFEKEFLSGLKLFS